MEPEGGAAEVPVRRERRWHAATVPPRHPLYLAWLAEAVAAGHPPAPVAVTGTARLGPRRDVPVVLVAPRDGLRSLHEG